MESNSNIDPALNVYTLLSFFGYILLILIIGVLSTKFSSKGLSEFFLGGRKMNKFVVALSAVVSGRSSWLLIGLTGMAYTIGITAIWAAAGYVFVEFLMFFFAAPRLRKHTGMHGDITIPDYFESRHIDSSHILRIISALIMIVFMTAYISAQFVGGGKLFSASFDIPLLSGMIITMLIVLIYTLLGGFLAVSLTDVIQAVFMLVGLFIVPVIAISDFGGVEKVYIELIEADKTLLDPFAAGFGIIIGFLGIGLGSPGNPHILVRYMSIKDPDELKFSAYVGTFWNFTMAVCAVLIGLVGRAYFNSAELLPGADPEKLFPFLSQLILNPLLFGFVIASILAAIMSTADSMLLVSASAVIRDIYQKVINPKRKLTDKDLVYYSRLLIFTLVLAALVIGLIAKDLVFWLVLFAWGGLGASFGPPILLSLFWPKCNKYGVAAGLITGMITIIVWNQTPYLKNQIYELVPAFLISLLCTFLISLLTQNKK